MSVQDNFFHISYNFYSWKYADDEKRNVELNYEQPSKAYIAPGDYENGEAKLEYYQIFKLHPNAYIFSLVIRSFEDDVKDSHFIKIGSVLKCSFKTLLTEDDTCLQNCKDLHLYR